MRVVIAPDKFAGTLSAAEAAAAIARGWRRVRPDDELRCVPMADGGEGSLGVVEAAVPGAQRHTTEVANARANATWASWLALPGGRAFIESAEVCGLSQLAPEERQPLLATTYGVGQLLQAVRRAGVGEVVVGLGGSATVDGGAGAALALGYRLRREDGNGVKVGNQKLRELHHIELTTPPPLRVVAAVDVDVPLLGSQGAVAGFARQKGAAPEELPVLEARLRRFADVTERDVPGGPWRDLAGAGAAGGLGFGLAAFTRAELVPGAEVVAELVGLEAALERADVVITGEGALDAQSAAGKTPVFVAAQARARAARVGVIAGRLDEQAAAAFDAAVALGDEGLERAAELTEVRAAELAPTLAQAVAQ